MKNESIIGFYSYALPHPGDDGFRSFYAEAMLLLQEVGLKPTYFAADGEGHKGESVPLNGRSHKNSLSKGFKKATLASLICNPEGSDAPAFDDFAEVSLSFLDSINQTLVTFSVDQSKFELNSTQFSSVIQWLLSLRDWQFGYAITARETRNPSYYLLGADDGKLTKVEMDALLLWYNSTPQMRLSKMRDVHPINFVNDAQLSLVGKSGLTLRQFIESEGRGGLSKISASLWRWDVPSDSIARLKGMLAHTGLTICGE